MNWLRSIKEQRGFTLLELLIVIAIIAILASAVIANLNSARNKAQDAKIRTELKSVDQAISVYLASDSPASLFGANNITTGVISSLTGLTSNNYIGKMPVHPNDPTYKYHYSYITNGNAYTLWAHLASDNQKCFVIEKGSGSDKACDTLAN